MKRTLILRLDHALAKLMPTTWRQLGEWAAKEKAKHEAEQRNAQKGHRR